MVTKGLQVPAWWWVADRALLRQVDAPSAPPVTGVLAAGPELAARAQSQGLDPVETIDDTTAGSVVPTDLAWFLRQCAAASPTGAALRGAATVDGVCLWPLIEYEVYQVELARWLERLVPLAHALKRKATPGTPLPLAHRPLPAAVRACLDTGDLATVEIVLDGVNEAEPTAASVRPTMPPPLQFLKGQRAAHAGNIRRRAARHSSGRPIALVLQEEMVATSAQGKAQLGLFQSVAEELEALDQPYLVVLNHTGTIPSAHHELDERFHLFQAELTPRQELTVRLRARALRARFARLCTDQQFRDGWRIGPIDLWPLLQPSLQHAFDSRMVGALRLLLGQRRLLRSLRPAAVAMIFEYGVFGRTLQWAAGELGVPAISLQHGNVFAGAAGFSWHPPGPSPAAAVRSAASPPVATVPDYMCAYGPFVARSLATQGVPADRVLATGPVHYDRMVRLADSPPPPPPSLATLAPFDGPLIVYTSQPLASFESRSLYLEGAVAALHHDPRWRLWVKPHPRESVGWFHEQLAAMDLQKELRDRILIDKEVDLGALLSHAWVVLSVYSTTATEAVLLHKPVILLSFEGMPERLPYVSSGVALEAATSGALAAALERVRDDPSASTAMAKARSAFLLDQICGERTGNRTVVAAALRAIATGGDPTDALSARGAQG